MKSFKKYIISNALLAAFICTVGINAQESVGTNTPDPSSALDVTSKTAGFLMPRMTSAERNAIVSPAAGLQVYDTTTNGHWYYNGTVWVQNTADGDTTDDAWINNTANNRIELSSLANGTTARPAGTQFVALDNGNVGIGTANPRTKLDLGTELGRKLSLWNNGSVFYGYGIETKRLDFYVEAGSTHTPGMTLWSQGFGTTGENSKHLGINTTLPTAELDVNGTSRIRNIPSGVASDGILTTDVDGNIRQRTATEIVAAGGGVTANDGDAWGVTGEDQASAIGRTGNVGIGTTTPSTLLDLGNTTGRKLSLFNNGSLFFGLGLEAGRLDFFTAANNTDDASMTLFNNSGDKRLGIQTTAPTANLDVNGNARVRTLPNGTATDGIVTTDANGNLRQRTLSDIAAAGNDGDAWGVTGEDVASAISRTGKVTINNNDQAALTLQTADNTLSNGIAFQNSGAAYTWNIFREDAGSNNANLVFAGGTINNDVTALTERMRIASNGNVGIDNASPVSPLTVGSTSNGSRFVADTRVGNANGDSRATIVVGEDATNSGFIAISSAGSNGQEFQMVNGADDASSDFMRFRSDATSTFIQGENRSNNSSFNLSASNNLTSLISTNSGSSTSINMVGQNIGIGTTSPQANLHISGNNGTNLYCSAANASVIGMHEQDNNKAWFLVSDGNDFNIRETSTSSANTRFAIEENGNIGIGTNNPNEKLHVIGNILASGTITPDYVFENYFDGESSLNPAYKMMTLKEVETYTRVNKHLPGVFSAKQVKDNGGILINRATEQNLEKIEELFLYTIEQEKKIKSQETTIKSQNEEIKKLSTAFDELKAQLEAIKALLKK